jgi:FixJ family two-component response regulator
VFDGAVRPQHLLHLADRQPPQVMSWSMNWPKIATELGLAEKTVKNYVSSILSKLEVARRAEAAAYLALHTTIRGS